MNLLDEFEPPDRELSHRAVDDGLVLLHAAWQDYAQLSADVIQDWTTHEEDLPVLLFGLAGLLVELFRVSGTSPPPATPTSPDPGNRTLQSRKWASELQEAWALGPHAVWRWCQRQVPPHVEPYERAGQLVAWGLAAIYTWEQREGRNGLELLERLSREVYLPSGKRPESAFDVRHVLEGWDET